MTSNNLYNLDWLQPGKQFPPKNQLVRISRYNHNKLLFYNYKKQVFIDYETRVNRIAGEFRHSAGLNIFGVELAYHQLLAIKKADLSVEEPPLVVGEEQQEEQIKDLLFNSMLLQSLPEVVYDLVRFGDSLIRVINDDGFPAISVINPEIWYPIVNEQNIKKIQQHVLCWLVDITPDEEKIKNKKYELHCQILEGNKYYNQQFRIKDYEDCTYDERWTGEQIKICRYTIGALIHRDEFWTDTGFSICPLQNFHNVTTSDSVYGVDDYERISSLVAELETRYTLGCLVLDKYTTPTMYGASSIIDKTAFGTYALISGNFLPVKTGDVVPGMISWDGNLTGNFEQIDKLQKQLYIMSELGMVIDDESYSGTQGFEALRIKFTNALLSIRRLQNRMTRPLKVIVGLLSEIDSKPTIEANQLTINWQDGIPESEITEIDKAVLEQQNGLNSLHRILINRYGMTPDQADEEIERIREERVDSNFMNASNDFNDELSDVQEEEEQPEPEQEEEDGEV